MVAAAWIDLGERPRSLAGSWPKKTRFGKEHKVLVNVGDLQKISREDLSN